jgi:hypothetical protein
LTQPLRIGDLGVVEEETGASRRSRSRTWWSPAGISDGSSYHGRSSSSILSRILAQNLVDADSRWDRRSFTVQVPECSVRTVDIRTQVSAADSGSLYDLRCGGRAYVLTWLQREHPQALPAISLIPHNATASLGVPA